MWQVPLSWSYSSLAALSLTLALRMLVGSVSLVKTSPGLLPPKHSMRMRPWILCTPENTICPCYFAQGEHVVCARNL